MDRRSFVSGLSAAAAAVVAAPPAAGQSNAAGALAAGDVHSFLKSHDGGWVKWDQTVDTFKSGGPDMKVEGIAVAWMPYVWTIRRALDLGCNLLVTHEPTYYDHRDADKTLFRFETAQQKKALIEKSGITILRCHDVWDQVPAIGIPAAWGKFLQLGEPVDGKGYFRVYDGKGRKARTVAQHIAARVASLGQPGVQFIGDEERPVRRIVLGTGAITRFFYFIDELKADLAICTDDGFTYWRDGAFAVDSGLPVVIVNHPVSEDEGMRLLADRLRGAFPKVPVHHIAGRCMYKIIGA